MMAIQIIFQIFTKLSCVDGYCVRLWIIDIAIYDVSKSVKFCEFKRIRVVQDQRNKRFWKRILKTVQRDCFSVIDVAQLQKGFKINSKAEIRENIFFAILKKKKFFFASFTIFYRNSAKKGHQKTDFEPCLRGKLEQRKRLYLSDSICNCVQIKISE